MRPANRARRLLAHLNTITAELQQAYTALAIYQRHQAKLGGAAAPPVAGGLDFVDGR